MCYVEGQQGGQLDFLAALAVAQQEFEEHEGDESEEGAQDMEEDGETAPHDNQASGEASLLSEDAGSGVHHQYALYMTMLGFSGVTAAL